MLKNLKIIKAIFHHKNSSISSTGFTFTPFIPPRLKLCFVGRSVFAVYGAKALRISLVNYALSTDFALEASFSVDSAVGSM